MTLDDEKDLDAVRRLREGLAEWGALLPRLPDDPDTVYTEDSDEGDWLSEQKRMIYSMNLALVLGCLADLDVPPQHQAVPRRLDELLYHSSGDKALHKVIGARRLSSSARRRRALVAASIDALLKLGHSLEEAGAIASKKLVKAHLPDFGLSLTTAKIDAKQIKEWRDEIRRKGDNGSYEFYDALLERVKYTTSSELKALVDEFFARAKLLDGPVL
jgi:hypothetical protein